MKRTLIIIFLFTGFSYAQQRYDQGKTVCPNDTLTFLKFDMMPVNGIVYNEFGDLGLFENGKPEGLHQRWYENGKLESEIQYKNGQYHGSRKQYYSNGKLASEGNFVNGKEDGTNKFWNEEGLLIRELYFNFGKREGQTRGWYVNEQLHFQLNFNEDKLDGTSKIWHENGQLMYNFAFKKGEPLGICRIWKESGQLFYEGEFKEEWKLGGNTALPILDCSLTELMSGFTINDEAWSIPSMEGLSEPVESWDEVEAEFNGGFEGLNQFIKDNIRPPAEVVELGVNGQVIVRFVVEKDGTVSNAVVVTKLVECPACDREALRVVTRMPKWKPASNAGREVRTFVRLPINFNTY